MVQLCSSSSNWHVRYFPRSAPLSHPRAPASGSACACKKTRPGEVGIFEMRSTGLEAVTNAAALFAPSTQTGSLQTLSDGSSRLLGTAIAVIQDGARPLPIEVQALVGPRVRVVTNDTAGGGGGSSRGGLGPLVFEDGDGVTDSATDGEGYGGEGFEGSGSASWSGGEEVDSSDDDDESMTTAAAAAAVGRGSDSSLHGAGLMRGAVDKFVAAEAGVSPKEILPMVRGVVGLQNPQRFGMLLEVLTMHTPIKVCWLKWGFEGAVGSGLRFNSDVLGCWWWGWRGLTHAGVVLLIV